MAPKWTQRPKRGVVKRVLRKPVTKDEASRQSRSVKKRPAASKPNYVPEYQKLDSEAAQLKDVTWMNGRLAQRSSCCRPCTRASACRNLLHAPIVDKSP